MLAKMKIIAFLADVWEKFKDVFLRGKALDILKVIFDRISTLWN